VIGFKDAKLTRWVLPLIVIASMISGCNENIDNTTRVSKKDGAVNVELCSGDTPFILRTKTGRAGEVLHCVTQADFDKYEINQVYP
jgi:hypothetical protein